MKGIISMKPGRDRMVTLDELERRPDPEPMGSRHAPVRYDEAIHRTIECMAAFGLTPSSMELALTHQESMLLAILNLEGASKVNGLETVNQMGIMMSETQKVRFTMTVGMSIWACTNLLMSGRSILVSAKQTLNADLRKQITAGVASYVIDKTGFHESCERMRERTLSDSDAKCMVYDMMQKDVIAGSRFAEIDKWYFQDPQPDTESRSQWGLYNSVTRSLRALPAQGKIEQTQKVGTYFDL